MRVVFWWFDSYMSTAGQKAKNREALADVLSYAVRMADCCWLDINEILCEKVNRNRLEYSVEKAKGNKDKYTELRRENCPAVAR